MRTIYLLHGDTVAINALLETYQLQPWYLTVEVTDLDSSKLDNLVLLLETKMDRGQTVIVHGGMQHRLQTEPLLIQYGYNLVDVSLDKKKRTYHNEHIDSVRFVQLMLHPVVKSTSVAQSRSLFSRMAYTNGMTIPSWSHRPFKGEIVTGLYKDILFVGDIQGCASALQQLLDEHWGSYRQTRLLIFTGDFLDRGPNNGLVFQIMCELLADPNTRALMGNHEVQMLNWALGKPTSTEFRTRTLPQLLAAGLTKEMVFSLLKSWDDLIQFEFYGKYVQVTHGGLKQWVEQPYLMDSITCWKGDGPYEEDVDAIFEASTQEHCYQVHGHRNDISRDLKAAQRSFNLEGSVEYGGELRAVLLNSEGFYPIAIRNTEFVPMQDRDLRRAKVVPNWIMSGTPAELAANHPTLSTYLESYRYEALEKNYTCNREREGILSADVPATERYPVPETYHCSTLNCEILAHVPTVEAHLVGVTADLGYDTYKDQLVCFPEGAWPAVDSDLQKHLTETGIMKLKISLRDMHLSLRFQMTGEGRRPKLINAFRRAIMISCLDQDQLDALASVHNLSRAG